MFGKLETFIYGCLSNILSSKKTNWYWHTTILAKIQKKGVNMKVKSKTSSTVMVEFSTEEYDAFIQLLQMKTSLKDYKGGK